jgi:hypothetical protein
MFVKERFFQKVREDESGCHLWTGARNIWGYGRHKIDKVTCSAHRTAWQLANGLVPAGLFVLHHCDNRRCVNPAHLYVGTQADNVRDMWDRGRWRPIEGRITCQRCGAECEQKGAGQKYCEACGPEAHRESSNRSMRRRRADPEWSAANRERQSRYRAANREKINERQRAIYAANRKTEVA